MMDATRGLKIRFHNWSAGTLLIFAIALTALFLFLVMTRFNSMAESNAEQRFQLLAQRGSEGLKDLLESTGRTLKAFASARPERFVKSGTLTTTEMIMPFLTALDSYPELYGVYFGLENDEFLQVIAVRNDPLVLKSLAAPAGTYYAVRSILMKAGGKREEMWEFWSRDRQVMATRAGSTDFFPKSRPWYGAAKAGTSLVITDPYQFASTGHLGITLSHVLRDGIGVVGLDIDLQSLRGYLSTVPLTPESAIVILDEANRIMAFHNVSKSYVKSDIAPMTAVASSGSEHLKVFDRWKDRDRESFGQKVVVDGKPFIYTRYLYAGGTGHQFQVGVFAPLSEFTGPIVAARNEMLMWVALLLVLVTPIVVVASRRVGRTLFTLAEDAERMQKFEFSGKTGNLRSVVYEVDTLGRAQTFMKDTVRQRTAALQVAEEKLEKLVENGILLSREQDRQKLLRHILFGGRDLLHCDAATMYLKTEQGTLRFALRTMDGELPSFEIPLKDAATGQPNDKFVSVYVANHIESVIIDDVYHETRFDLSGTIRFAEESGYRTVSMLTVPMSPREGEVTGVLQFMNALDPETGKVIPFPPMFVNFVEALAAQAAVALENQNLLEAQRNLMDSMIKLLAGAIDAKSPYTGGHCERVPELAIMLADEAAKVSEGPLAEFRFQSDAERREFRIGAWLHDCGKVTTPEYVVDKATKLETIYNRIHEIRTRFEVLLRDAEIECFRSQQEGMDAGEAARRLESRRKELLDDFSFLADCNLGGEFMAPERVERLKKIASRTWLRHFDDRIGLSHEELQRYRREPVESLPAVEHLLSDKIHHIVARVADKTTDPKYGFKVKVPEHQFNFGEMYNLSIGRGTLTEEERYKINEHIIQTIIMLDQMPFPKELRRVPEYAGTHHETLIGSGYPRKLNKDDLSVPARIMAIADIFEALTASDRPYKSPKTLSDSIKILAYFKKDQHIDPDLFELFLRSGVYRRYAERYLRPEQIDSVDIEQYLH